MGMADGTNTKPTVQWELLWTFAQNHGILDWSSPGASAENQERRQNLATDLQRSFRVESDPIEYQCRIKGGRPALQQALGE